MSLSDEMLTANAAWAPSWRAAHPDTPPAPPARQTAVLTCMDARIDPLAAFGLEVGAAHVIRNAGGLVTPDALRSLALSQRALGTREVVLVHHTRCGLQDFDDAAFRAELSAETGATPDWDAPGFSDVDAAVRRAVETVRACPWLPHRDAVRGFVWDVASGELREP